MDAQRKEAKERAKILLENKELFNKAFEEIFKKYDRNGDNTISLTEYLDFLDEMLKAAGRTNYSLEVKSLNFDRADKDGDGVIEKEEFRKEFLKRIKEIVY